jgi:hypothetical protein
MRLSFSYAQPLRAIPSLHRAPLLSLSKDLPLHRHHLYASTPSGVPAYAFRHLRPTRYHRIDTFRPRRFSRPRRLAPHGALQVYCTLLPVMGSTRFPIFSSSSRDRPKPVRVTCEPKFLPKQSFPLSSTTLYVSNQSSEDDPLLT